MSTAAPALGGTSGSTLPPLHSAWNPYAVLPATTKKKLDPANVLPANTPYLAALSIPAAAAADRIEAKYLQLDPPAGKLSDRRRAQLAARQDERDAKRLRRQREADCGLVGKRRRAGREKGKGKEVVRYESLVPVHHLWLGYMAELLQLPIQATPPPPPPPPPPASAEPTSTHTSATLLPTFVPRAHDLAASALGADLGKLNVPAIQMKLVKAEFVGCILSVKRAKNPSLVRLQGLVLQETQSTFKIVTPDSAVKILPKEGSIFSLTLPLAPAAGAAGSATRALSLDIYGDAFAYRSADRVGRKWKAGSGAGGVELK